MLLNNVLSFFLIRFTDSEGEKEGFYFSIQIRNNHHAAVLAIPIETRPSTSLPSSSGTKKTKIDKKKEQIYQIYRPNAGLQIRPELLAELEISKVTKYGSRETFATTIIRFIR